MEISYLIIDNFYDDPYPVRNAALHTDYERRVGEVYYPGDNSVGAFEVEGLTEIVSRLVQEPVMRTSDSAPAVARRNWQCAVSGVLITGSCTNLETISLSPSTSKDLTELSPG